MNIPFDIRTQERAIRIATGLLWGGGLASLMMLAGGCAASDDGGTAQSASASGGAAYASSDASATSRQQCAALERAQSCRMRSNCVWLTATCGGESTTLGCRPRSENIDLSGACEDAGQVEETRDAGGSVTSDTSSRSDTGTHACRGRGRSACRSTSRCKWWPPTCQGQSVEARCIPRDHYPEPPPCSGDDRGARDAGIGTPTDTGVVADTSKDAPHADAGPPRRDEGISGDANVPDSGGAGGTDAGRPPDVGADCGTISDSSNCRQQSSCRWWAAQCHGTTVETQCISKQAKPPPVQCKPDTPDQCQRVQLKSNCSRPHCRWTVPGCSGGSGDTIEVRGCLPSTNCADTADCPDQHYCRKIWHNPCAGKPCQACGSSERRCIPKNRMP